MIVHQIEALVAAGVTDIVLAVNYRPEVMEKFLAEVRAATALLSARILTLVTVRGEVQHQHRVLRRD